MNLLSRKVDYALLILAFLHGRAEGACASAVAEHLGLSRAFVANILKVLCQKRFVVSRRGIKGGYQLSRPAGAITVADLMDALEDSFHLAECCRESPGDGCWLFGVCPIRGPIALVHRRIRELLGRVTLAELLGPAPPAGTVEIEVSRCQRLQPLSSAR